MKYRDIPTGFIAGRVPGEWREFEAEPGSPGLELVIHTPELLVERWDGKAWVPASWRLLSGTEQARIIERQHLVGQAERARKLAERRLTAAREAAAAATSTLEAAAAREKATRAALAEAEQAAKAAEAEAKRYEARIAELTKELVPA